MNPRVTVGLLAVLIALGAYVYYGPSVGTPAPAGAAVTPTAVVQLDLWKLDDGQVQTIEVQRGADRAGLRRTADGWVVLPANEPADALRVNSLIFRLASLRATRRLEAVTNLDEYGLGAPNVVATIGMADGTSHTLKLGVKAPAEAGTYAVKYADTTVYLVSNAVAQDLERLVSDPPIPPPASPSPSPAAALGGPSTTPSP
jgi:hypothetical protein